MESELHRHERRHPTRCCPHAARCRDNQISPLFARLGQEACKPGCLRSDNGRAAVASPVTPDCRACLGIEIEDGNRKAEFLGGYGQVQGYGGLSGTTLPADDG